MISLPRHRLSQMDQALSGDLVLSAVLELFPAPPLDSELIESPARVASRAKPARLRAAVRRPELIAITAVVLLTVGAIVGGLLGNTIIVLTGLGAAILLGVGCHFAIKRRTADQPDRMGRLGQR